MTSHLYYEARNCARRIIKCEAQESRPHPAESGDRVVSRCDRVSPVESVRRLSISDRFGGYYPRKKDDHFTYSDSIGVDVTNNDKLVDVFVHTGDSGVHDLRTYLQAKRAFKEVSHWEPNDSDTEMYEVPDFKEEDSEDNETELITCPIFKCEDFPEQEEKCSEEQEQEDQFLDQTEWPKPCNAAPFERFDKLSDVDSSDLVLEDVGCQETPIILEEGYEMDYEVQRKREEERRCEEEQRENEEQKTREEERKSEDQRKNTEQERSQEQGKNEEKVSSGEQSTSEEQKRCDERQKRIAEERALVEKKIMALKEKKSLPRKDSIPAKETPAYHKERIVIDSAIPTLADSKIDYGSAHPLWVDIDLTHKCDMEQVTPSRSRIIPNPHSDSVEKSKTKVKSSVSDEPHVPETKPAKLTMSQYHKRSTSVTECEQRVKFAKLSRNVSLNEVEMHHGDSLGDLLGATQRERDTRHVIDVKAPQDPMLFGSADGDQMLHERDTREVIDVKSHTPTPIHGGADGDIIVVDMEMDSNSSPPHVTNPAPVVQQSPVLRSPEEIEAQQALESYYQCSFEEEVVIDGRAPDDSRPPTPMDASRTPSSTDSNSAATVSGNPSSVWDRLSKSPGLRKALSERPFANLGMPGGTPPLLPDWGSPSEEKSHCLFSTHQSRTEQKKEKPVKGSSSNQDRSRPHEGPPRSEKHGSGRARSDHRSTGHSSKPSQRSPKKYSSHPSKQYTFHSPLPETSPPSPQDTSYKLVKFETITPLVPDVLGSASLSKSRQRTKKESLTKKRTNTPDSNEGGNSKRPTKPETKGKFHTRTLLMGKGVEPRFIPLDPLYLVKPYTSRGEPQVVPIDPRIKFYQKKKQSLQAEDDLYVDALL